MSESPKKLDLAAVRTRLEKARGREYWRSLEDLAASKAMATGRAFQDRRKFSILGWQR